MGIAETAKTSVAKVRAASGTAVDQLSKVGHRDWMRRGYSMPAPQRVKWAVLDRYGAGVDVWVETGTFRGETTAHLAGQAPRVYSIEPSAELARGATTTFAGNPRVTILHGVSEVELPKVLEGLAGGSVAFWLDGHFSAGITFQGDADTPIREELAAIEQHRAKFSRVVVLVDDVRCFEPTDPEYSHYPDRSWLVGWADRNQLRWNIEHDIFVAWS
ncbi:hypothetical protein BH10ACT10_BH10ACT10_02920 [soil metagenome]